MSKSLAPGSTARSSVIASSRLIPDVGRRLWDDDPGPIGAYARLCARTPDAARELTLQSQERLPAPPWGGPSLADGLPTVPAALNVVLDTAMELSASPQGRSRLSPELLNWLPESGAHSHSWQSPSGALASRSLRAMDPSDSELLWWSCVEGLSDGVVAGQLGLSQADAASEVVRVTADFREQSWLIHRLELQSPVCRSYAGLLDATARQSAQAAPRDLLEHLGRCSVCVEAFGCLSEANVLLPAVIADAVLFWGGSAYISRRHEQVSRRSVSVSQRPPRSHKSLARGSGIRLGGRPALKAVAAGVGLVLLGGALSLLGDDPASQDDSPGLSTAQSGSLPGPDRDESERDGRVGASQRPSEPSASASTKRGSPPSDTSREPSGDASAHRSPQKEEPRKSASPPACSAVFQVRNQWNEGVEASLGITSRTALSEGWKVTFRMPDKAGVNVWNGEATQAGNLVTVTASSYNMTVPDGKLTVGMVLAFDYADAYVPGTWLSDVQVNGSSCPL
ncbi:cellulose binding domain-containing protein [Streptomyces microflavus]|uniref:cellulose binding domain-containing protein n=1 Tax=Streptomyces microflavus TaxID=1919 RepID=UPI0037F7D5FC